MPMIISIGGKNVTCCAIVCVEKWNDTLESRVTRITADLANVPKFWKDFPKISMTGTSWSQEVNVGTSIMKYSINCVPLIEGN